MEAKWKELKRDVKWALEVGYGASQVATVVKNPPVSAGDMRRGFGP